MKTHERLTTFGSIAITVALSLPPTASGDDSAAIFRDNCLKCHTLDKVASTAGEGTEAEQKDNLKTLFRSHPKKPVEFSKESMMEYLLKEFAARAK
jgi:hypothetical protein